VRRQVEGGEPKQPPLKIGDYKVVSYQISYQEEQGRFSTRFGS
jgi:hypothetical protein